VGIEWFRDLSITILGFVTTAVLIFVAILAYRLYRTIKSTVLLIKATSKIAFDTVSLVQEGIKPLLPILTLIQGICGGFQGFNKIFKKESNEGGNSNE
jgi:hypothetical protein